MTERSKKLVVQRRENFVVICPRCGENCGCEFVSYADAREHLLEELDVPHCLCDRDKDKNRDRAILVAVRKYWDEIEYVDARARSVTELKELMREARNRLLDELNEAEKEV